MVLLEVYSVFIVAASLITLYLLLRFPSLPKSGNLNRVQKVSIIVPARNEADTIRDCIESLLKLDYPSKEIIVVEGNSTDDTGKILEEYRDRIKIVNEEELPSGWIGKNWACHNGYKNSSGELLLFTDGDTIHSLDSLRRTVSYLQENKADLVTISAKFRTRSFWERLMLPTIVHFIFLYFWGPKVNDDKSPHYVANGQYILISRDVYEKVDGHSAIRTEIIEDVRLAESVKKAGFKVRVLYGFDALQNMMYANFSELWEGWVKNAFAGFRLSVPFLIEGLAIIIIGFLLPFIIAVYGLWLALFQGVNSYLLFGSLMVGSLYLVMSIEYAKLADSLHFVFLFPVALILFIGIILDSYRRVTSGRGVVWKGRKYDLLRNLTNRV